jgi:hypothetical protein
MVTRAMVVGNTHSLSLSLSHTLSLSLSLPLCLWLAVLPVGGVAKRLGRNAALHFPDSGGGGGVGGPVFAQSGFGAAVTSESATARTAFATRDDKCKQVLFGIILSWLKTRIAGSQVNGRLGNSPHAV